MAKVKIKEDTLRNMVRESVENALLESTFHNTYCRTRDFHSQNDKRFGFELRKGGEWHYGDIEYNIETNTLSCLGVSIKVDLKQSFRENLEDLFEELCNNGYDTDF